MSLNLLLVSKKESCFDLWETPTHITLMCLSLNEKDNPDGGKRGVLRRYLLWVDSHLNGVFRNQEEIDHLKKQITQHKRELTTWIKKHSSHKWELT